MRAQSTAAAYRRTPVRYANPVRPSSCPVEVTVAAPATRSAAPCPASSSTSSSTAATHGDARYARASTYRSLRPKATEAASNSSPAQAANTASMTRAYVAEMPLP